ncbi:MAG: antibiotic biosynthesis monooxygenase, partial [Clostridia bacterium]|nr:antibiotic biosynthesis monooxygenase [Clostridia bacterium]
MYSIYVKFTCHEGKREAFVEKMRSEGILDAVRNEDGCIRYDYYFSEKEPLELLLIEQWETKQHQQIHIGQPHMASMREFKGDFITNTVLGEVELK